MSHGWDIKCISCDTACGPFTQYVTLEHAREAIRNHYILTTIAMSGGLQLQREGPLELKVTVMSRSGETGLDLAWFALHTYSGPPHKLVAVNDYGAIDGACNEFLHCRCGARHMCELPAGHPPPCSIFEPGTRTVVPQGST